MAATSVSIQIHTLLEKPRRDKSEAGVLALLDAEFPTLEMLNDYDGLQSAIEQAEHEDVKFADLVRTKGLPVMALH